MIMLIIMVLGTITILVSVLNSSGLQIGRDKTTADALAKAKDALIGYAASNPNRPGELPCPDFDNNGVIDSSDYNGSNCQRLIGWLPWKTLGLPDLRDANGDRLWYAVADPFRTNSSAILNSDTPTAYPAQMLTVLDGATSATLESGVIAIVFSPSTVLAGESRSANDNNVTNVIQNYLEGENANFDTVFKTANDKVAPVPNPVVNDRLLTINYSVLFPPVEMRIAREVKICLDNYAAMPVATNGNLPGLKYPLPAPVSGSTVTLFGRISGTPNTGGGATAVPPQISALLGLQNLLGSLQIALTAFNANPNAANTNNLATAAQNVINATNNPLVSNSVNNAVDNAGDRARDLANGTGVSLATVNNAVANANAALTTALAGYTPPPGADPAMSPSWPASCTIFNNPSSYFWTSWNTLGFYQVASGFEPNSGATFGTPLTINGSGAYRAAVLIARRAIPPKLRNDPADVTLYLEGINQHSGSTPATTFETYNQSDPIYPTVNDLVLCLDGKGTNLGSVCQ